MKVYQSFSLLLALAATLLEIALAQHSPRNVQQRSRLHSPGRNKKVKRHNLQRPVKPVYHSPPINAFSLKDLHKDEEEEVFPPAPIRSSTHGTRFSGFSKPLLSADGSDEAKYFASLNNQFSAPNFGSEYFSPSPSLFKQGKPASVSRPPKKGSSFGLYGPDFGSITDLYDDKDAVNDGLESFAGSFKKPYHTFEIAETPKLLKPTYASVKPANIQHVASSGHGFPSNFYSGGDDESYNHKDAHYNFGYEVSNPGKHSYDPQVFGHGEQRDGDTTKGRYHVLLPDGRHQNVAYTADHSGYHAQVSYTSRNGR
ncbi:uncharacterized protein LOC135941643 isoform X1 [Cloeon dipterum]|uniref:uncharacterized protein LOC135941643 isoform X1 n=1 Tax=Cloeon dipterum TaxID=197152 RepID=UPI00321F746E